MWSIDKVIQKEIFMMYKLGIQFGDINARTGSEDQEQSGEIDLWLK